MIETIKAANGRYIDYEVIEDKCDFIPGQEVSIQDCVNRGLVPVEATNLEYDSDENGENVSFDERRKQSEVPTAEATPANEPVEFSIVASEPVPPAVLATADTCTGAVTEPRNSGR